MILSLVYILEKLRNINSFDVLQHVSGTMLSTPTEPPLISRIEYSSPETRTQLIPPNTLTLSPKRIFFHLFKCHLRHSIIVIPVPNICLYIRSHISIVVSTPKLSCMDDY